jgi:hypothetical protein
MDLREGEVAIDYIDSLKKGMLTEGATIVGFMGLLNLDSSDEGRIARQLVHGHDTQAIACLGKPR